MSKTLAQLRTAALIEADMTGLVVSDDADVVIQEECQELYDMLVEAFEDYNVTLSSELTPSGANDYVALPADFYKLRAVDLKVGADWVDMEPFSLEERNDLGTARYLIHGDRLMIRPTTLAATTTVRMYYTPVLGAVSTFEGRGFEKRVELACAIRFKQMEQSDASALKERLSAMDQRIERMRKNRNSGRPKKVVDVRKSFDYYRRRGIWPEDLV